MTTFWRHTYHLVWATKLRAPLITSVIEPELNRFLADKAEEMGCTVLAINGMPDHVHLAISIPPKHSVSTVVQRLNGASSHHVNSLNANTDAHFAWQDGFGSLPVSERNRDQAIAYVQHQKRHHVDGSTNS